MRASSDACVAMWLAVGVNALLPFGAEAQCTELMCDVAVNASIDTASETDCFALTATDGEIIDISVVSQATGSSFQPACHTHTGPHSVLLTWKLQFLLSIGAIA